MNFSFTTREQALRRFSDEVFDVLIIGGGITGAATARDAAMRGLKVALVEQRDFAWGTSSRSTKLIHGGLRYLQNFEFKLVFEALAERTHLLKTMPNLVRPLSFYFPVYQGDKPGKFLIGLGMWLYDFLAMFRAPGFHRTLSRKAFLQVFPDVKPEGLKGAFQYYDASMWDDVLTVETLRSAHQAGAVVANYVEAVAPLWKGQRITGYRLRDLKKSPGAGEIDIQAHQVIVCAGPWTDQVGATLSKNWKTWLAPSRGLHLVFDLKRLPVAGAMVMNNPEDKRIAFAIPRPDLGTGVAIVGTTDGPVPKRPEDIEIDTADVSYLMHLVNKYFPKLNLTLDDVVSAYVGIRPLVGTPDGGALQKVSREHLIGEGPGGTIVVAGGKYTTHRTMGQEIVDFTLALRKQYSVKGLIAPLTKNLTKAKANTKSPINPRSTAEAIALFKNEAQSRNVEVNAELLNRYGADATYILEMDAAVGGGTHLKEEDPPGFPKLSAQLRYAIRNEMVYHLEDFYLRRVPLYLARADHGLPWAEELAKVWADERGLGESEAQAELERLRLELQKRSAWRVKCRSGSEA